MPRRLRGTSSKVLPSQSGLRQKKASRGKAYVPHEVQRLPSSAGPSASVVNQPSTAGTLVLVAIGAV